MPFRRSAALWSVLGALALLTPLLPAQVTTATVYGIVNDPSGAVVPGALAR